MAVAVDGVHCIELTTTTNALTPEYIIKQIVWAGQTSTTNAFKLVDTASNLICEAVAGTLAPVIIPIRRPKQRFVGIKLVAHATGTFTGKVLVQKG